MEKAEYRAISVAKNTQKTTLRQGWVFLSQERCIVKSGAFYRQWLNANGAPPLCRKSRLIKETPIHNFVAMGFSCEFLHWTCSEPHNGKWCNLKCSNESIRCSDRLLYSQITPTSRLPSTCYHTRPTNNQNNSVFKAKRQTFIPKTVSDETRIFIHYSCVVHIVAVLFTLYLCYSHYNFVVHIIYVLFTL